MDVRPPLRFSGRCGNEAWHMRYKARPTVYKGIQMRSRLEARFAAYLDGFGRPWQYEPQCFANEDGQYLPDFLTHDNAGTACYYEIKPTQRQCLDAIPLMRIILDSDPTAELIAMYDNDDGGFALGYVHSQEDEDGKYYKAMHNLSDSKSGPSLGDVWEAEQRRRAIERQQTPEMKAEIRRQKAALEAWEAARHPDQTERDKDNDDWFGP